LGHVELAKRLADLIRAMPTDDAVAALNEVRELLHEASPMKAEPVDFVRWVKSDTVIANDYNPNHVAPPEMRLLQHSIESDGYTQPVVGFSIGTGYEVVDGFHRYRCGTEVKTIRERIRGYLPVVQINESRSELCNRVASTIRHNRARGKHQVTAMSEIVSDLSKRNWSDEKIAKELGMDADEVLRLKQITGLAELFSDREFSEAWEAE
jgi:ParB-like chromosome segregation protein Spo0J